MAQDFLVLPNPEAKNGDFDFTIVKEQQIFLGKLAFQTIDLATIHNLRAQKETNHAAQIILLALAGINPDAQTFVDQHIADFKILTTHDLVRPLNADASLPLENAA